MNSRHDEQDGSHPLEQLNSLTQYHVNQLHDQWITTVEGFLGLTATPEGRSGLNQLLGVSQEQMEELVGEAVVVVGPDAVERLTTPRPGGPTGAVLEDNQKEEGG